MINCPSPCPTPECTRWTTVNEGQPIKIFHDNDEWNPNYYTNVSAPDAVVYFQQAIEVWNNAYPCGDLFEPVATFAESEAYVVYSPNPGPGNAVGLTSCFCDVDNEVCQIHVDHSEQFSSAQGNKQFMQLFCSPLVQGISVNQWINVYVHELGHVLGMGHVSGIPNVLSVMGIRDDSSEILQLYPWDIKELTRRYPCCGNGDDGFTEQPSDN